MEYNIGMSSRPEAEMCVQEATASLRKPKLILFFSPVEKFEEYSALIHQKFPESICMGATTMVAWSRGSADKRTLKVVGIESGIQCSAGVLEDIDRYPLKYADRVRKCVDEVKNTKNTICLEFTTALLCAEESVLTALNTVLSDENIPVFGGSAGDEGTAKATKVSLNGKVCERGCVFAIIHNEGGAIKVFRENIYSPKTGNILTATKVDSRTRTVFEYDNQPAAKVFARELGVSESQIKSYIDTNPVGRIVGNEMYITANCAVTPEKGMVYHARIYNNSKVMVLKPDNYREIIQKTVQRIKKEIPRPSFSIVCHCLARTILFEKEGYVSEYSGILDTTLGNYIGFSGYGEQYGTQHFNQTMTVAVFE